MKKTAVFLSLFCFLAAQPAVYAQPNFEKIKETANPKAEAPLSFVEDRTFDDEVKGKPPVLPTDLFAQGPISSPTPGNNSSPASFRPEIDDEVVIGITVGNEADVLEFFNKSRTKALAGAIGEGASDTLALFVKQAQDVIKVDILKILIGMNKLLQETAGNGAATSLTRQLTGYVRDVVAAIRHELGHGLTLLAQANSTEEIAQASKDTQVGLATALETFNHKLESLSQKFVDEYVEDGFKLLAGQLRDAVFQLGAVTRDTINQLAGQALLKQTQDNVNSFFDIWFELDVVTDNKHPDEMAALGEGMSDAMAAYRKTVFDSFMDYTDDLLIAETPQERANAAKSLESKLLLAKAQFIQTTEQLYAIAGQKMDAKTQALLADSLLAAKDVIHQLSLEVADWGDVFAGEFQHCMYPVCGG